MSLERKQTAATIDDVAAAAGVSRSTVSRALGGYGQVSAAAQERIEAAAQKLHYSVNLAAKSTRTGKSMTLGLVVADLSERFFSEVARGFTDAARAAGYQVILANTDDDVDEQTNAIHALLKFRVDGLAVAPAQTIGSSSAQASLGPLRVPVVAIDRRVPDGEADVVLLNSHGAAYTAVSHLLDAGHRRIGMVTGLSADLGVVEHPGPQGRNAPLPGATSSGEAHAEGDARGIESPDPASQTAARHSPSPGTERVRGYVQALTERGITPTPDLVLRTPRALAEAAEAAAGMLARPDRPTAVFASDELHTLATLLGAGKVGLSIPDDLSLVAIDDPDWVAAVAPPLSVVAQPSYEVGRTAGLRLLERLDGEDSAPREDIMDFTWVPRASIASPGD